MVIRHLLHLARGAVTLLVVSTAARIVALVCGAALLAYPAWVAGRLADNAMLAAGVPIQPGVWAVVLVMLGLAAVKAASRYLEQYAGHVAAFTLLARLRTRLYDRLVPLAPAVTEARGSGQLLSTAVRDVDRVEVFYAHTIAPAVTAILIPGGAVALAAAVAGPAPAMVLGGGFLVGGAALLGIGGRTSGSTARRLVTARGRLAQEVSDDVRGHTEIVTFGAQEQRAARVDARGGEVGEALHATATPLGLRAAAQAGWQVATVLALVWAGAGPVAAGDLTMSALLLVVALVPGGAPALGSVEAFSRSLPAALASARNLLELESTQPAVKDPPVPAAPGLVRGTVALSAVSFAYPGRAGAVLNGVDLELPAGSVTAVVGVTGSGKSTLGRLLTRTWDPDAGAVTLDGQDLRDLALEDVRRAVTVVDQRPVLLAGTVGENLLLARPDATEAELVSVCEAACFGADLAALPDGLDTRLGEDGARLSGGQAQRLALARGYLRGSPVLVLDEITSHQDPLTQAEILRRMRRAATGTVVLIAHRSAVLSHVDRIYQVEDGRVHQLRH